MKLSKKTALVTGGSGGIGAAIARQLASEGAVVTLTYNGNKSRADEVVEDIVQAGGNASAQKLNLNDLDEISSVFTAIKGEQNGIDILVNCAAIAALTPLRELNMEAYERVFSTNVRSILWILHLAFTHISAGGRIINISSATVRRPSAGTSVYTSSKAAVNSITEIASKELGELGITVNALMPGPTVPGMFENMPESVKDAEAQRSPFKRLGSAKDIADVVTFLASDDARWITGQVISADGGSYS